MWFNAQAHLAFGNSREVRIFVTGADLNDLVFAAAPTGASSWGVRAHAHPALLVRQGSDQIKDPKLRRIMTNLRHEPVAGDAGSCWIDTGRGCIAS